MITLQDLLAQPHLRLHPVWCPKPNLELRWAASSEQNDPSTFLEGEELLLSTTCGNPKTSQDWLFYLKRLREKRISALGFGVGEHFPSVPKELVRAARKLDFNLIEVAEEESFVRISQTLGRLIEEDHLTEEKRLQYLQQELIQASAQPQALVAIIQTLAKATGGYVQLGRVGEESQYSAGDLSQVFDTGVQLLDEFWAKLPSNVQSYTDRQADHFVLATACPYSRNRHWWVVVIGAGTVQSWMPGALRVASILIGANLEYVGATRQTVERLVARAYELVVKGEVETGRILVEMAFPQSQRLEGRFEVLAIQATPELLRRYRTQLLEQDDAIFPPAIMRLEGDQMWALVAAGAAPLALAQLEQQIRWQQRHGKEAISGESIGSGGVAVGISALHPLTQIKNAQRQAKLAMKKASVRQPIVKWTEMLEKGLSEVLVGETVAQFSQDFLAPVKADPKMMSLLSCFCATNGNRLQIATNLGINRNTVRQRIRQVEHKLNCNVDDPAFRAALWVALQNV